MTDHDEKLRQKVLAEVARRQMKDIGTPNETRQMKLLGQFIKTRLETMHIAENDLAERVEIKPQVLALLIDGEIPGWMLSDETLIRLSRQMLVETNVLRVMLGRTAIITKGRESEETARQ